LDFGRSAASAPYGFAYLDTYGHPNLDAPLDLWITCRFTHCFALGSLLGHSFCDALVDHGLAALGGAFADTTYGGWFSQIAPDGQPTDATKAAYAHAFVVLAASSAAAAGRPGAQELLHRALTEQNVHFWEPADGMVVDVFSRDFSRSDSYRGINANMHTVEAYLAAADASGDSRWRLRALRIAERIVNEASKADWRIPEHFTPAWEPLPDYNSERPKDQFRPYGATPGHAFEWSRLILELRAALGSEAPAWMKPSAERLFHRAYEDSWRDSPSPGFVYTTNWLGQAVIENHLHWVAAEAVAAAITAFRVTGDPLYHHLYSRWWEMIAHQFIDQKRGSWIHELSPSGNASSELWEGKPDIYHALQATLIPRLPLTPSLAMALRLGLLDSH
jgi:mannose/cellobiose epimerase-like protein (N-acyl-D-glucosamine 2-epimerase family)